MSADTVKANAMLAGLGRTRRVILGDNLLEQFTPDEIEVIFAHEIGHHVHGHIRKMILLGGLYSLAGFWVCDRLLTAWISWQGQAVDYAHFPIHTLPLLLLIVTLLATLTEPLQNLVSRYFERQCDQYALDRTKLPAAYVSAFEKLAKLNKDDPDPHPVEVFFLHSHPPIRQRLALAEEGARGRD
ncbi:MAG: M48 family metalloprotease, partial [Planctomycetales bacterium]|nr:M48 family metalloprotease [Planctomycetales bacterium]